MLRAALASWQWQSDSGANFRSLVGCSIGSEPRLADDVAGSDHLPLTGCSPLAPRPNRVWHETRSGTGDGVERLPLTAWLDSSPAGAGVQSRWRPSQCAL
jgi:hypothetical protein